MSHAQTHRIRRIRSRLAGTAERPRLMVERSNKHMRLQVIDDQTGRTLLYASDNEVKGKETGTKRVEALGVLLADRVKAAGIKTLVFDRRGHRYHGQVKALADAVRAGGITI